MPPNRCASLSALCHLPHARGKCHLEGRHSRTAFELFGIWRIASVRVRYRRMVSSGVRQRYPSEEPFSGETSCAAVPAVALWYMATSSLFPAIRRPSMAGSEAVRAFHNRYSPEYCNGAACIFVMLRLSTPCFAAIRAASWTTVTASSSELFPSMT